MWSLTISGKHCSIKLSWTTPGYLLECVVDVGFPPAALCAGHRVHILILPMAADSLVPVSICFPLFSIGLVQKGFHIAPAFCR